MPDPVSPQSQEWWLNRLIEKYVVDLAEREQHAQLYDSTNSGPRPPEGGREVYLRLMKMSRTPWGRLVVDIVAERMEMQGLNSADAPETASQLWTLFRQNRVEALQRHVHREALALGTSYVSVWASNGGGTVPVKIAYETAMCVTHETAAGDPDTTEAAIKVWHSTIDGHGRANLYLPSATYRFRSKSTYSTDENWRVSLSGKTIQWEQIGDPVGNPRGVVPIVPFVTRPNWQGYGTSDLEDLRAVIERIESLTSSTLLAVELGAFRQKWATGVEVPKDENGKYVEPYRAAIDRVWIGQAEDSRFGSFDATDVRPYLQAVSDAVGQLSAVSRIPTLYFNQSELSNPPSAASLEASETGLINRVMERRDPYSESWERVAEKAGAIAGLPPVELIDVSWRDPRTRSEGQVVDAATKLISIGVPWRSVMEYVGFNSTEIDEMERLRAADTFNRLLSSPLPGATTTAEAPSAPPPPSQNPRNQVAMQMGLDLG